MKDSQFEDLFKKSSEMDRDFPFEESRWNDLERRMDKGKSPFPGTLWWMLPIILSGVFLAFAKWQWNKEVLVYQKQIETLQATVDQIALTSKSIDTIYIKEIITQENNTTNSDVAAQQVGKVSTTRTPKSPIPYNRYLADANLVAPLSIPKHYFNWELVANNISPNEVYIAKEESAAQKQMAFVQKAVPLFHQETRETLGKKIYTEAEKAILEEAPVAIDYSKLNPVAPPPFRLHQFYLNDEFNSIASGGISESSVLAELHRQKFKPKPKWEIGFTYGYAASKIVASTTLLTTNDIGNPTLSVGKFTDPSTGRSYDLFLNTAATLSIEQPSIFRSYRVHAARRMTDVFWLKGALIYHTSQLNRDLPVSSFPKNKTFTTFVAGAEKLFTFELGMQWNIMERNKFTPFVGLSGLLDSYRINQQEDRIVSYSNAVNANFRTLSDQQFDVQLAGASIELGVKYRVLPKIEIGLQSYFFGRFRRFENRFPAFGMFATYKL